MRATRYGAGRALAAALALGAAVVMPHQTGATPAAHTARLTPTAAAAASPGHDARERARRAYAATPLAFERNAGQAPEGAAFVARGLGLQAQVSGSGASVKHGDAALVLRIPGADPNAAGRALERLDSTTTYLMGGKPSGSTLENFGRVRFDGVLPGVSVEYSGTRERVDVAFDVAAGAPSVPLAFDGARAVRVEGGALVLETEHGRAYVARPDARDAAGRALAARFAADGDAFRLAVDTSGAYTATTSLAVDKADAPASGEEEGWSVVLDQAGNIYIGGATASALFPAVDALQGAISSPFDGFITKLSPSGQLLQSTFLGGNDGDGVHAITLDAAGNIYVGGATASTNFPLASPIQSQNNSTCDLFTGCFDAFVAKISPDGRSLLFSTYLGGESDDEVNAIRVDPATGDVVIGGSTNSETFPTANAIDPTWGGGFCGIAPCPDAFAARISGASLVYSTYHGGFGYDVGQDLALDSAGNAILVGWTAAEDYPVVNPVQARLRGELDGFAAKIAPAGTSLVYSTYLGGGSTDGANGVAVDANDNAVLAGFSYSLDYPTRAALQEGNGGVYTTGNGAAQWTKVNEGLKASPVFLSVGVDPTNPLVAYAGSETEGLFKTTDGGASWTKVPRFFPGLPIRAIAVDPSDPSVVFVGTQEGLWKSADGGTTFARLEKGIPTESIAAIAVDPTDSQTVFALGAITGLYKSADGGASWELKTDRASFALAVHPNQPSVVFATGFGRVLESVDGGETFTEVSENGLPVTSLYAVAFDPTNPQTVYVGTVGNGIYKSTDGGATWFQAAAGVTSGIVVSLLADPTSPSTLYLGMEGDRAFRLGKTGRTAEERATVSALFPLSLGRRVETTAAGGSHEGAAKAAVNTNGGVFKSTDGGFTWTPANTGLTSNGVVDVALAPSDPSRLYVATTQRGDAVVTRLDPSGQIVSSTYWGGGDEESAAAVALDAAGNVYIAGNTWSMDLPTASPAQAGKGSPLWADGFVAKLDPAAGSLLGATFVGGEEDDFFMGLAVDGAGAPVATGVTISRDFPLAGALQPVYGDGGSDAVVTKLAPGFSALGFSTYLGGWSAKPFVDGARLVQGGRLAVFGAFFDTGATVYINQQRQVTGNWPADPAGTLFVAKPGTKLLPGLTYRIQVRNRNGNFSDPFLWTVPQPQ